MQTKPQRFQPFLCTSASSSTFCLLIYFLEGGEMPTKIHQRSKKKTLQHIVNRTQGFHTLESVLTASENVPKLEDRNGMAKYICYTCHNFLSLKTCLRFFKIQMLETEKRTRNKNKMFFGRRAGG